MRIGMLIGGVLMAGAGVATALFLPNFLEKDAAEFAASSNAVYSAETASDAKEGDKFIFHGTLAASNPEIERGMVIGTKSVWEERDRLAAERAQSKEDKQRARAGWRVVEEYTQVLAVDLDTGAPAELRLDTIRVEGKQESVEDDVGGRKYQWRGLRRGTEVSVRATIAGLEPLRIEQTRGQSLHLSKPQAIIEGEAATTAAVAKWTYVGGLGFAGIGGLLLILGVVLRRS
jgi:hypothetical protein